MSAYDTIDALRESLAQPAKSIRTPEYIANMMHQVPEAKVIDRAPFIIERCKGKRVLEFGASGVVHDAIREVAASYYGVDRTADFEVVAFDLDDVKWESLPGSKWFDEGNYIEPDVIVCGEVLEHLTNPGFFLQRLRAQFDNIPVIITVPNAFTDAGMHHMRDGIENVNLDHVCWYSYRTLKTLLERYAYTIDEFYWYQGKPLFAEGMIVVAR